MKKEYRKPNIIITKFQLNHTIASCAYTSETTYKEQTINCVINGAETIFYDNGCKNTASNGKLVTYDDTLYYVWYNGKVATKPDADQQTLIDAILSLAGVKGQPGWHAGPATAEIISIHNMS